MASTRGHCKLERQYGVVVVFPNIKVMCVTKSTIRPRHLIQLAPTRSLGPCTYPGTRLPRGCAACERPCVIATSRGAGSPLSTDYCLHHFNDTSSCPSSNGCNVDEACKYIAGASDACTLVEHVQSKNGRESAWGMMVLARRQRPVTLG